MFRVNKTMDSDDPLSPAAKSLLKGSPGGGGRNGHNQNTKPQQPTKNQHQEKDQHHAFAKPMPQINFRGNEIQKIGPSTLDPSLLNGLVPQGKLALQDGPADGSIAAPSGMGSSIIIKKDNPQPTTPNKSKERLTLDRNNSLSKRNTNRKPSKDRITTRKSSKDKVRTADSQTDLHRGESKERASNKSIQTHRQPPVNIKTKGRVKSSVKHKQQKK